MGPSKTDSHSIDVSAIEQQSSSTNHQNHGISAQASLKTSIEEQMETLCSTICIYKVPEEISIDNTSVFVPIKVSIGPFHQGNPVLKPMEDHKWRYLCSLLKRDPSNHNHLMEIVEVIENYEDTVRKCYAVEFDLDRKEFTQMLLLDCCFILELLLRYFIRSPRRRTDPIFTTPGLLFDLRCDLILLENQVPFFLLKKIFEKLQIPQLENNSLNDLSFRFFRTMVVGERQFLNEKFMQEGDHFLDMVHYCFLSSFPRVEPKENSKPKSLPSASMLQKKGIKFKAVRNAKSLLDIKFHNGVLEIPPLKVYQRSQTILRNLIAYEHCQFGSAQQVKSYVYLLGHLLETDKDVKLLCRRGILTDNEDDETLVGGNLRWMTQQKSSLSGAYFAGVFQKIDESSNRCTAWLRTWTKHPLVIGIAAILAVGIIFAAAFFSALSFLRHRYG